MPQQVVRQRNVIAFGAQALKGLALAVVGGSVVLGGAQYFDRSQVTQAEIEYGTGSFLVYDDVVCTNTGGLAKYTACSWQNPSSTSTGVLMRVQVDSEAAPSAAKITCSTSIAGTNTGTVLFKYIATASGESVGTNVMVTPTGTGGKLIIVPPSQYIRCWHSTTPQSGGTEEAPLKEQLRIWYSKYYAP